jgi:hypothetical protein
MKQPKETTMKNILLMLLISGLASAQADSATAAKATDVSGMTSTAKSADASLTAKLKKNITVEFKECAFTDVIDYLRKVSDVNFIVTGKPEATVTLTLKNLPLEQVIRYLGELTGMEAAVKENAVVFRAKATDAAQAGAGGYKMETSVEATKEPHQYTVAIKIHHSPDGKQWDVLSAPRIVVRAGQEGKIEIKDDKTDNGVECTVLVNEAAAGVVEMNVVCKVQEAGRAPWQSELKTRIKLP